MDAISICELLTKVQFNYVNEMELQAGIAQVLTGAKITFEREVRITGADRLDFLTDAGIAIEVKVEGPLSAVTRQLFRYAANDQIKELILVTNRNAHKRVPEAVYGKPLFLVHLAAF